MKKIYLFQFRTTLTVYQFNLSFYQKQTNYSEMLCDLLGPRFSETIFDEPSLNYIHYNLLLLLLSTLSKFNRRNSEYKRLRKFLSDYFSTEQLAGMLTTIDLRYKFLTTCPIVYHYFVKRQVDFTIDSDLPF